jgi:hypothetical protein
MTADTLALDTEFIPRYLSCGRCGRTRACAPADARVYAVIGPPSCCGRAMAFPVSAAPPPPVPAGRRRPARRGAGVEVRRGGQARGPDLAGGLVDLSADGLGVHLEVQMVPGEAVDVTLRAPGSPRPIARPGQVRWCRPAAGGRYLAGVRLAPPLTPAEVDALSR